MHRRTFLAQGAVLASAGMIAPSRLLANVAGDLPGDVKITRVVGFVLHTRRSKIAGRNSHKKVHGDRAGDRMLRIYTNKGVNAIGACNASRAATEKLLGAKPRDLFQRDARRMVGPLGVGTMPLWDLAGKLLGQPAYKLLGGAGPEQVPVYDGSIYFADLLPQYAAKWQDRLRREIDMGVAAGHVAFKIKIGRGFKWMDRKGGGRARRGRR